VRWEGVYEESSTAISEWRWWTT